MESQPAEAEIDEEARKVQEEIERLEREINYLEKKENNELTYEVDKTNEITLGKDYIDQDPTAGSNLKVGVEKSKYSNI